MRGHRPVAEAQEGAGAFEQMIDHRRCAPAIGLHGKTEPLSTPCERIAHQGLDDLQRELQAVLLLGIDGQGNTAFCREAPQFECARQQLTERALAMQQRVARIER